MSKALEVVRVKKRTFAAVFRDTLPVMTGYLFLGVGFGILMQEKGYGTLWSFCMALFMYAGSAQYLTVSLLASKASVLSAALSVLLVNARHIFYGITMLDAYRDTGKKKPYLIFALTDETYSLVTQNQPPEGMKRGTYCLLVSVLDHFYWVVGCTLGGLLGAAVPISFQGVEFVLTALFVTIFTEQWLTAKEHRPAIIGVASTVLCLIVFGKDIFLVPSMVLIALILTVSRKTGRRDTA